jgi:hypothetical protein
VELLLFLLGTLSILLTQLVLAGGLVGIGLVVHRGVGPRPITLDDGFRAFWVGLAGTQDAPRAARAIVDSTSPQVPIR